MLPQFSCRGCRYHQRTQQLQVDLSYRRRRCLKQVPAHLPFQLRPEKQSGTIHYDVVPKNADDEMKS